MQVCAMLDSESRKIRTQCPKLYILFTTSGNFSSSSAAVSLEGTTDLKFKLAPGLQGATVREIP
jgi:hypothetical protein